MYYINTDNPRSTFVCDRSRNKYPRQLGDFWSQSIDDGPTVCRPCIGVAKIFYSDPCWPQMETASEGLASMRSHESGFYLNYDAGFPRGPGIHNSRQACAVTKYPIVPFSYDYARIIREYSAQTTRPRNKLREPAQTTRRRANYENFLVHLTSAHRCMRITSESDQVAELLSLSALSRRLDLPYPRAIELHARGVIVPDYVTSTAILFRPSRLPELRAAIKQAR